MDLKKLKFLYDKAVAEKNNIRDTYNNILELTDPFDVIRDEGKTSIGAMRDVDSDVLTSIDTLCSYIMSSVLPKGSQWADLEIDENRMKEQFDISSVTKRIEEASETMQSDVSKVFRYIQNSNYYEEVTKAVKDFIRVGTGCYAIRETGVTSSPFTFEYVGLDNLYLLNDNFSKIGIVFKKHPEVNGEYLKDVFGSDIVLEDGISEEEYDKSTTVYECVVSTYDEEQALDIYNYVICSENFDKIYLEKTLNYNPFVCFRWETTSGTSWGVSVVLNQANLLKELSLYKTMFKKQAMNIANPPKLFTGNVELFESLQMEDGAINYGGDPMYGGYSPNIQVIGNGSNLMPLDNVIRDLLGRFKESIMVSHLSMNINDTKYNTAMAVQMLHEMFRHRFANTYELMNSELIKPTFLSPFIIMMKYGLLNTVEDAVPYVSIKYVSELTKSNNNSQINRLMSYLNTAHQVEQYNSAGVMIDLSKTLPYIQDLMEIPRELVPSESEIKEYQEIKRQMVQQQMAMQQQQQQGGIEDVENRQEI